MLVHSPHPTESRLQLSVLLFAMCEDEIYHPSAACKMLFRKVMWPPASFPGQLWRRFTWRQRDLIPGNSLGHLSMLKRHGVRFCG